jgi:hypothetical protein
MEAISRNIFGPQSCEQDDLCTEWGPMGRSIVDCFRQVPCHCCELKDFRKPLGGGPNDGGNVA